MPLDDDAQHDRGLGTLSSLADRLSRCVEDGEDCWKSFMFAERSRRAGLVEELRYLRDTLGLSDTELQLSQLAATAAGGAHIHISWQHTPAASGTPADQPVETATPPTTWRS